MTLCTTADVEALIQSDITNDLDPMIVAMLEMASEEISAVLGRDAEPGVAYTGQRFWIPAGNQTLALLTEHFPLASIDQLTEGGTALVAGTDYTVDLEAGRLYRLSSAGGPVFWATGTEILVDYTTAPIPGARTICAAATARAFKSGEEHANRPTIMAGFRQLTIGRWSATRESGTAHQSLEPISLTDRERATILSWKNRSP